MKRIAMIFLVATAGLLLAGCPKKPTIVPPTATSEAVAPVSGATTNAAQQDASQVRPLGAARAEGVVCGGVPAL